MMIVWVLGRRVSENCTWSCENRNWWLSFWTLWHRLWDSPCSCSLTQSLCLWTSLIVVMTPLINKYERDIYDRIYPEKTFIMEDLHNCNVTWFFISSPVTPSPTIRPSVYIFMVHHDDTYVFSFDWIVIFSLFRMKTFHYVFILEGRENMNPSGGKNN
jgi:hypothetical protein